jgi:hypothetical protein
VRTSGLVLTAAIVAVALTAACFVPVPPLFQCNNRVDDDGDGTADFPLDPGCESATDTTEGPDPGLPIPLAACLDGRDNDTDGLIDFPVDPGCSSGVDADEENPQLGPGNAHRMIVWAAYEKLVHFSDAQLDLWKSRGADGFVVQTRYLDEIGGVEMWTGDPTDPLNLIVEGHDVHEKQRTLRDNRFVERCHERGLKVYLGIYLSNYHNLSTPLKVWNDDDGWTQILPIARGAAGAAKLLGMDGMATDSEMYRDDSRQTWNWDYPGVREAEATVREQARQRGKQFMSALLAEFPDIEIINYRIEIPGSWEERVQQQVNGVTGVWNKSVFPDFWGGMAEVEGYRAIYFLDPIFYKSWHIRSGWDEALDYNVKGVRQTLSQRWANWAYAEKRFFISPFAWIDPGPSASEFDDARPPDHVARQLDAFHRWGQGNTFGLYTQHIDDFDYTPYVPAMQAASTPDAPSARSLAEDNPRAPERMSERQESGAAAVENVAEPRTTGTLSLGSVLVAECGDGVRLVVGGDASSSVAFVIDALQRLHVVQVFEIHGPDGASRWFAIGASTNAVCGPFRRS